MKKELELAKQNYKARKNIKRLSIRPHTIKGTTLESNTIFIVNGTKMVLISKGQNSDFAKLR